MTVDEGWIPRKHYQSEIDEHLERSAREGVFIGFQRSFRTSRARRLKVNLIIWRPGDPNQLAACIIENCTGPMTLDLDGHRYRIEPE